MTDWHDENIGSLEEARRLSKAAGSPTFSVTGALEEQHGSAKADLTTPVEIIDVDTFPGPDDLYVEARKWLRIRNVVAVSTDLKDSTSLNFDKYAQTSARLYQAVTGSVVRVFSLFNPQFVDIQGDGVFALFHGERAYERALCAGVSIKTLSANSIGPLIDENFSDSFPDTGLKTGIASGILTAKKVGVRGTNEPVWAGKPVNYAVKCAQKADRHELVITEAVYDKVTPNDYIEYSCGCRADGLAAPLWSEIEVEKLGKHSKCMFLTSQWCSQHGDEFCRAILAGEKKREGMKIATISSADTYSGAA